MQVSVMGMGWYLEEDYPRILEIMEDAHLLPSTWKDWDKKAQTGERDMKGRGLRVVRAIIKPEEFLAWCRARGLKVDAKARMQWGNEIAYRSIKGSQ